MHGSRINADSLENPSRRFLRRGDIQGRDIFTDSARASVPDGREKCIS
jgi:hypothetical protein